VRLSVAPDCAGSQTYPRKVDDARLRVQVHQVVDDAALQEAADVVDDKLLADVDELDVWAFLLLHGLVRGCAVVQPKSPHGRCMSE